MRYLISKLENVRKYVLDEQMLLPYYLEAWLSSWGCDSVWVRVHEILIFGNSALYLNILLECY